MTARRQSSTTSLQKYARNQAANDDLGNRSLEFCNAFWGVADGGYDVLLARIRAAVKTTEELRAFWKERAAIEEEYARRLGKLAKQALGKDELGELRKSIDTMRLETDNQATAHANLAQLIRREVEQPVVELLNKQGQFKRTTLASVEKSFKAKQTQEQYVKKARQKYEDDCMRINSYTAKSTLVQGKELEKMQIRLEKSKATVSTNEREYAQFARALADTTQRWEKEWKAFCDACQDSEEERIEFMKDNMWAYANAVSTVCVSDDEACEHLRVSLEQVEAEKDVENFVRDYTTGPQMPDPPPFVDYNSPNASQQASKLTYRIAKFPRASNRNLNLGYSQSPYPPEEPEPVSAGQAGIGAVGIKTASAPTNSRPNSAAANRAAPAATNGTSSSGPSPATFQPVASSGSSVKTSNQSIKGGASSAAVQGSSAPKPATSQTPFRSQAQDPLAEPIDPRADTMLKIGPNAYPVNIGQDQQRPNPVVAPVANVGGQDDPLAKQIQELRRGAGSVRSGSSGQGSREVTTPTATSTATSPPSAVSQTTQSFARAPSPAPNAPTAAYMLPPSSRSTSPLPVEEVVGNYHQHLPGEISRENSVNRGRQPGQSSQGGAPRGVSPAREGHAGIGAHGGSRSPSPLPVSRPVSPAVGQQRGHLGYPAPGPQQGPNRAQSPLGIDIDPSGRVAHDDMVDRMYGQQQANRLSYNSGHSNAQSQGSYGDNYSGRNVSTTPAYGQPVNQQRQYANQAPPQQHSAAGSPQSYYAPQRNNQAPLYNPHQVQPQRQGTVPPANTYAVPPPPPLQQPVHPTQAGGYGYEQGYQQPAGYAPQSNGYSNQEYTYAQQQQQQQQPSNYRSVSPAPANRSPSPAVNAANRPPPTGQYTETGEPVLFYVKALYDYQATIDEEFDFQSGDIIAVTATPEDGWWSGELLDEMRRVPGKTIFPSNFVSLF